jgi:hypothetical protein
MTNHFNSSAALVEIANKTKVSLNDGNLVFGMACYDAGAIEILRHIAELELTKTEFYSSDHTKKMNRITEDKYQELLNAIHRSERPMAEAFDQAWHDYSAAEAYDYFVEGFISGYRFLKDHIAHKGENA